MQLADLAAADAAILIMGKAHGTKRANHQLHGRVAMAAAIWHCLGARRLSVFFLAADSHGPSGTPDGVVVERLLTTQYRVPPDCVHLRRWSLCTVTEVCGMRILARARGYRTILAITHGYHARRARAYFAQVGVAVEMVRPELSSLHALPLPADQPDLCRAIEHAIIAARPHPLDVAREGCVEALLTLLHRLDSRGRVERWLARRLRT